MSIEKASGIYQITCGATGARYIGSALKLSRRWQQHQAMANRGAHDNIHLQRAWDKYGATNFVFSVVELVPEDMEALIAAEQRWIDTAKPEFNICRVAGRVLGTKRSAESRARISAASKGRVTSQETKKKLSDALKGRTTSAETRAKLSAGNKGKKRTAEQNVRNSEVRKGRPITPECAAKISAANKGRAKSDETKEKLRAAHLGKPKPPLTEDHKRRISETLKATKAKQTVAKASAVADTASPAPQG